MRNHNRLKEFRAARRVTQFQLRLLTGINQSRISMIENGLIEPREDEREALARALGYPVEKVFGAKSGSVD